MKPFQKNQYCSFCGNRFDESQPFPRTCSHCNNITYVNPLPVAVLLLPVDDGLLLIRRNIEPQKGKLALPGGFINLGESWQVAAARELFEETGFEIEATEIEDFRVLSAPDGTVLIFGLAKPRTFADLPAFIASEETSEFVILKVPEELAFSLHTQVVEEYFKPKRN